MLRQRRGAAAKPSTHPMGPTSSADHLDPHETGGPHLYPRARLDPRDGRCRSGRGSPPCPVVLSWRAGHGLSIPPPGHLIDPRFFFSTWKAGRPRITPCVYRTLDAPSTASEAPNKTARIHVFIFLKFFMYIPYKRTSLSMRKVGF